MTQITNDGSFSGSPMKVEENKIRSKTGVLVKNLFDGVKFTSNPLNDYQGFEKKSELWQM